MVCWLGTPIGCVDGGVLDALLRNADDAESADDDAEELEAVLGNDYPVDVGALGFATWSCYAGRFLRDYRSYRGRSYVGRRLYSVEPSHIAFQSTPPF